MVAVKCMYRWWLVSQIEEIEPDLDRMGSETFAAYVAKLLAGQGYQVRLTPDGHDYGADLILERENTRIVVQTKRQSEYVGVAAIQQVVAAKAMYGCAEAMVVTNTMYAQSALHLAQSNQVVLWDRPIVLKEIADRQARRRAANVRALALHRLSSLSAVVIAGVLLSGGLAGYWRQGFSAFKPTPQPSANDLFQPAEPGLSGMLAAVEPADRNIAVEGINSEDSCGNAVVQDVAALAIREAPSLQSVAVGEVPQGRSIALICEAVVADGLAWQMVDYGLGRGWMSRKYLLVEQP